MLAPAPHTWRAAAASLRYLVICGHPFDGDEQRGVGRPAAGARGLGEDSRPATSQLGLDRPRPIQRTAEAKGVDAWTVYHLPSTPPSSATRAAPSGRWRPGAPAPSLRGWRVATGPTRSSGLSSAACRRRPLMRSLHCTLNMPRRRPGPAGVCICVAPPRARRGLPGLKGCTLNK
jgi:hypothetical protein